MAFHISRLLKRPSAVKKVTGPTFCQVTFQSRVASWLKRDVSSQRNSLHITAECAAVSPIQKLKNNIKKNLQNHSSLFLTTHKTPSSCAQIALAASATLSSPPSARSESLPVFHLRLSFTKDPCDWCFLATALHKLHSRTRSSGNLPLVTEGTDRPPRLVTTPPDRCRLCPPRTLLFFSPF